MTDSARARNLMTPIWMLASGKNFPSIAFRELPF
jgi:hypothetical protein